MPPSNESNVVRGLYHWLTPLLIIALASLIGWVGSAIVEHLSAQGAQLTHIEVQIAKMQEQYAYGQINTTAEQAQINQILTTQADHEHRITVLEQADHYRYREGVPHGR